MQFSSIIIALFAGIAAASPLETRQSGLCSALESPLCCDVTIEGVANLNCAAPPPTVMTTQQFTAACNAQGQAAYCCTLSIRGEALVCKAQ